MIERHVPALAQRFAAMRGPRWSGIAPTPLGPTERPEPPTTVEACRIADIAAHRARIAELGAALARGW